MKQFNYDTTLKEYEKEILIKCKNIVKRLDPAAEVILYGSRARGDAKDDSDFDLLILTDTEVSLEKEDLIRSELYPFELDTGAVLTVFLIGKTKWNSPLYQAMPFHQNVMNEGISL